MANQDIKDYLFFAIIIELFNTLDFYLRGVIMGQINSYENPFVLIVAHIVSGPIALSADLLIYYEVTDIHFITILLRNLKCLTTFSGYNFYLDLIEMTKFTRPLLLTYLSIIIVWICFYSALYGNALP